MGPSCHSHWPFDLEENAPVAWVLVSLVRVHWHVRGRHPNVKSGPGQSSSPVIFLILQQLLLVVKTVDW